MRISQRYWILRCTITTPSRCGKRRRGKRCSDGRVCVGIAQRANRSRCSRLSAERVMIMRKNLNRFLSRHDHEPTP